MARRKKSRSRTSVPWKGWGAISPQGHARTVMFKECGGKRNSPSKCFLGPGKSFPVCAKGTCDVNAKGLWAAYIRARQWGGSPSKYKGKSRPTMAQHQYLNVAETAKAALKNRGYEVGKSRFRFRSKRRGRPRKSRRRSVKRRSIRRKSVYRSNKRRGRPRKSRKRKSVKRRSIRRKSVYRSNKRRGRPRKSRSRKRR